MLARLTPAGLRDSSFGAAGEVIGADEDGSWETGGLALQADGKIVVGGALTPSLAAMMADGTAELLALRFNANGTPDATFATAGRAETHYGSFYHGYVGDVAVLSDGRIVVGGGTADNDGLLAWLSPTGTILSQERSGGMGTYGKGLQSVTGLIPKPGGGVWVVGDGFVVESHAGPGQTAERLAVKPGAEFAYASTAVIGSDGKLSLVGSFAKDNYTLLDGGSTVVRLADPCAIREPDDVRAVADQPEPAPRTGYPPGRGEPVAVDGQRAASRARLPSARGRLSSGRPTSPPAPRRPRTSPPASTRSPPRTRAANWDASSTTFTIVVPPVFTYATTLGPRRRRRPTARPSS